jgi:hypothetical protein
VAWSKSGAFWLGHWQPSASAGADMALLIFPLAIVLGWFVHSPGRAAAVTAAIGIGVLALYLLLGVTGVVVSPLETTVLLLGTPLAAFLAFRVAQWRRSRRTTRG